MWVNYPMADDDERIAIQYEYKINDFRRIRYRAPNEEKEDKIPLLTSPNVNQFHRDAIVFLQFCHFYECAVVLICGSQFVSVLSSSKIRTAESGNRWKTCDHSDASRSHQFPID